LLIPTIFCFFSICILAVIYYYDSFSGPELAIGAIGSGLASLVGRIVGNVDPKTFALWVQAGLSGSLGSFFSSPLLGILLMHELGGGRGGLTTMSCRRRPLTTSIDGTTNNRENEQSLIPFKGDSFLERMVTSGASAIMTSLVLNYIFQGVYWQNNNGSLENDDFEAWHWALAIPMGLLGGLVASMVLATTCACRTIRIRVSESFQLPYWGQVLLFCTLGGLFHGLLGCYRSPMTDFGISFLTNAMNSMQSDDSVTSPVSFLVMALVQGLRVSICIGFGLVGGMFVPMAFVGACIGLAVTSSIFPLSLAVPCCMASCVGALCPTPLTIVMATSLLFHLTGEQMTSVWIATMVAQTLVGGFGILPRRLGIQMVCLLESEQELQRLHLQDTEDNDDMYMQQPSLSDDAIVRGVRSAIFGPASS
jgi:H+/Cl- antiporter ClcA